jgi:hypothetical protein
MGTMPVCRGGSVTALNIQIFNFTHEELNLHGSRGQDVENRMYLHGRKSKIGYAEEDWVIPRSIRLDFLY